MGRYQRLVGWPPAEIHRRESVSQAQQCKCGRRTPAHTQRTGVGVSSLAPWSENELVDALPLYPSVVQPSIPTMHPLMSCNQAIWDINYIFLIPR